MVSVSAKTVIEISLSTRKKNGATPSTQFFECSSSFYAVVLHLRAIVASAGHLQPEQRRKERVQWMNVNMLIEAFETACSHFYCSTWKADYYNIVPPRTTVTRSPTISLNTSLKQETRGLFRHIMSFDMLILTICLIAHSHHQYHTNICACFTPNSTKRFLPANLSWFCFWLFFFNWEKKWNPWMFLKDAACLAIATTVDCS